MSFKEKKIFFFFQIFNFSFKSLLNHLFLKYSIEPQLKRHYPPID
jgi:hypothetical protein